MLTCDLSEHSLKSGDIGTVVLVHQDGAGYEVEFATLGGETITVLTLLSSQVRAVGQREIPHARALA